MKVSEEQVTLELIEEMMTLFEAHNTETASSLGPLDINAEVYLRMQGANALTMIVARQGDVAIGYLLLLFFNHLHHQTVRVAAQDIFFVRPDYRHLRVGLTMFLTAEVAAMKHGAHFIQANASESQPLEPFYDKQGYQLLEKQYYKQIGGAGWQSRQQPPS